MNSNNPENILLGFRSPDFEHRELYSSIIRNTISKEDYLLLESAFEVSKTNGDIYTILIHNLFDDLRRKFNLKRGNIV